MVTFIDAKVCRRAATRGATRLADLVKSDGIFTYQYSYGSAEPPAPDYDLHRHFCAGWALRHIGLHMRDGAPIAHKGSLAISGGLEKFSVPAPDDAICLAYLERVEISACGLALFATSFLDSDVTAKTTLIAKAIGKYILNQRTRDGDFAHIRQLPSFDPIPLRGDYSTPQALLGLFHLAKLTGESDWSEEALAMLASLSSRRDSPLQANHWTLYCLEAALNASNDLKWYEYARDRVERLLEAPLPQNGGASCWHSCNCEAILTWMRMARVADRSSEDRQLYDRAFLRLKTMLRKLVGFQLKDGGFINAPATRLVQIDFIQHAIIALWEFAELKEFS